MADRSSRPRRCPWQIAVSATAGIEVLRRRRMTRGRIAQELGLSRATVYRVVQRRRLSRLAAIDPPVPAERCEHASPGSLLHLDIKKPGCTGRIGRRINGDRRTRVDGVGWEFVHVAIDERSRIAFSRILKDERHHSAVEFLKLAVQYYEALGVRIERVLTSGRKASNRGLMRRSTYRCVGTPVMLQARGLATCVRAEAKPGLFLNCLFRGDTTQKMKSLTEQELVHLVLRTRPWNPLL
jgi:predicted transcriptional regulator